MGRFSGLIGSLLRSPTYTLPAYTSPAYTSPVYTPPAYTLSAYRSPAYTPSLNELSRCNSAGFDLNRHWRSPNFRHHPTIAAVKAFLRQLAHSDCVCVDYFVDIHAHTSTMNGFVYCNQMEGDKQKNELQTIFPRLLDLYCPDFSFLRSRFCSNPRKAGSGRMAMGDVLLREATCCYTLEVSFFCSMQGNVKGDPYTEENYKDIGKSIAMAFSDIFKVPRCQRSNLGSFKNLLPASAMNGRLSRPLTMDGDARQTVSNTSVQMISE
eukprot:992632_1